jgi:hypothetical protein
LGTLKRYREFREKCTVMKRTIQFIFLAFLVPPLFLFDFRPSGSPPVLPPKTTPLSSGSRLALQQKYGELPMAFEVNEGQTDSQARFLSHGKGYSLALTGREVLLALPSSPQAFQSRGGFPHPFPNSKRALTVKISTIRMCLKGARPSPEAEGMEKLPGFSNYFIGDDPSKWRVKVPQYAKVKFKQVYPGVDMVYYGNRGRLEYDFIVAPGTDPKVIQLAYDGVNRTRVKSGDLRLNVGASELVFKAPRIYQKKEGREIPVQGRYVRAGDNKVGFEISPYDHSRPLVIDPVLDYSTLLGGSTWDSIYGLAVDTSGDACVVGSTAGSFPTTSGSYQPSFTGANDIFVAKLSADGSTLLYSTYLGGSNTQSGSSILLDANGNAFATGGTNSTDFPTTSNSYQPVYPGGSPGVLFELSADGSKLLYSTFLPLGAGGIVMDPSGNLFTIGGAAIQKIHPGGGGAADFLATTNLQGSAYGSLSAIAVDNGGSPYVTGFTQASNFPTTPGAFDTIYRGPQEAFVAKFSADLSTMIYSTFFGGSGVHYGNSIAVDRNGNAFITGSSSGNLPITPGAFQTVATGTASNCYAAEISSDGSSVLYCTYLSGSYAQQGAAIVLDSNGHIFLTGWENSPSGFPLTAGAYQTTGAAATAFIAKINPAGGGSSDLVYCTLFGGNNVTYGDSLALDGQNNVYIGGYTPSTVFPVSTTAFQKTYGGGTYDGFAAKFDATAFGNPTATPTPAGTWFTSTPTNSYTPTVSRTPTNTFTITPTNSPTNTWTNSPTATPTNSPTLSPTTTPANSATNTTTLTATGTPSNSPTPTVTYSPTITRTPTNSPTVTDTLMPTDSPTLTPTSTASSTPSDSPTNSPSATVTATPTSTLSNTPTNSSTISFTPTVTYTPTMTNTPAITNTPTPTSTFGVSSVVIGPAYPNPANGPGPVSLQAQVPDGSTLEWSVFTTSFRKVLDISNPISGNNAVLVWNLEDNWQRPVASGLYYLRVQVSGPVKASKIVKILVIR